MRMMAVGIFPFLVFASAEDWSLLGVHRPVQNVRGFVPMTRQNFIVMGAVLLHHTTARLLIHIPPGTTGQPRVR